jgi:serine/threonine-protein kinase
MQFVDGEPLGNPDAPLPDYVTRNALNNINDNIAATEIGLLPRPTKEAIEPIERLGSQAWGIGHLLTILDVDGAVRVDPLVLRYYDLYFPSQSLLIAAKSLNLGPDDIQVDLGEGVQLGNLSIGTDSALQMRTFFYGEQDGRPAFPVDSFYDVYTGKIPADKYHDKIVLIGASAFGVGAPQVTPVAEAMEPVLIMAHSVASILNENFFVRPGWGFWLEILLFLAVAAYLVALLPRLKAGMAAGFSAALFVLLVATEVGLLASQSLWLKLVLPATLLFVGHLLLTTKRFLVTERGKLKSETESAESNKMLGLAFQQQGQLDMAFEKFRKHPLDDEIMEPLYNLALDYERKRAFAKATSVYEYMAKYDPKFRDLEDRRKRSKAMEDTVMFGGAASGPGASLILDGDGVQKPMLGRYEVEKELGKGAMGIVYLGRDPKINRVVAIKTMALAQEFEADELDEVKERFFREAETAGRLQNPNIVTIYDAGEEHDLAFIAMEFLEGHDLVPYTKSDNLLPVSRVMGIIYKCALALDYAHKQNVVHRDIKPANVMYEPKSKKIKITDFGIARITDSSKTKTGMVLGTPSYMSPEQLSGKKIDGRSDLFSLGVMLYQLVTARLPFRGDSMATLMYKIANEEPPSVFELRPELKTKRPCLAKIIEKALVKDLNARYQSGAEMARDLHACAKQSAAQGTASA